MVNAKDFFKIVIVNVVIILVTICCYDRFFSTKIVTIDTTSFLKDVGNRYTKGQIDKKQMDAELMVLSNAINSQAGNKIILIKDMVVSKNVETIKLR